MGLNITQAMNFSQFESKENLRNAAKNILKRQTNSEEAVKKIFDDTTIFTSQSNSFKISAHDSILKASVQATMSESLKETLKYLKSCTNKKEIKNPVFGELYKSYSDKDSEVFEALELEFDFSANNFFIAA